ncbi:MAG TPA: hypothetical protein VFE05_19335 [Longimicrobiaceae bacterium]|nr:hypothetical protein [Longimicrobiaceae bacterium]
MGRRFEEQHLDSAEIRKGLKAALLLLVAVPALWFVLSRGFRAMRGPPAASLTLDSPLGDPLLTGPVDLREGNVVIAGHDEVGRLQTVRRVSPADSRPYRVWVGEWRDGQPSAALRRVPGLIAWVESCDLKHPNVIHLLPAASVDAGYPVGRLFLGGDVLDVYATAQEAPACR